VILAAKLDTKSEFEMDESMVESTASRMADKKVVESVGSKDL
jgi:hypothetical protein